MLLPDESKIAAAVQAVSASPSPSEGCRTAPAVGSTSAWRRAPSQQWRIRVFEVGQLTRADEVHGLVHLSVGQRPLRSACG
jgi:hypothetical protein